jgi:hypothetical protein
MLRLQTLNGITIIGKGKDLHDNKSLMHYDIKPHMIMHLVLLRGGMHSESSGIGGKYKRLPLPFMI